MSITDELREWAGKPDGYDVWTPRDYKHLMHIADRIDQEHERVAARIWKNATESVVGADLDRYVELPTVADGPLHVGDRIHLSHNGMDKVVTSLMWDGDAWIVGCDSGGCFLLPEAKDYVTHGTREAKS